MLSRASAASAPSDRRTRGHHRRTAAHGEPPKSGRRRGRSARGAWRDRSHIERSVVGFPDPTVRQRSAPRFAHHVLETGQRSRAAGLGKRLVIGRSDADPSPPLPCTASTAVCSASSSSARRFRLDAKVSPIRRIASLSRTRSRDNSSSRRQSSLDMLLNSAPSAANSSLPSTLIGEDKSPLPSRRAASRKPLRRPWSEREASIEKPTASTRKATIGTTAMARLPPSELAVADSADRTVTVARARPKAVNVWLTAR